MKLKSWLFVVLFLNCSCSFGQLNKLLGVWISSTSDAISIDTTKIGPNIGYSILSNSKREVFNFIVNLNLDTLSFERKSPQYSERVNFDFIIISYTDSTLVLQPCSKQSRILFEDRPQLNLIRQEYAV